MKQTMTIRQHKLSIQEILTVASVFALPIQPLITQYGMLFFMFLSAAYSIIVVVANASFRSNTFIAMYLIYIVFSLATVPFCVSLGSAYLRLRDMLIAVVWIFAIVQYATADSKESVVRRKVEQLLCAYVAGVFVISVYAYIFDSSMIRSWARLGWNLFDVYGNNFMHFTYLLIISTCYCFYRFINAVQTRGAIMYYWLSLTAFFYLTGILTGVRKTMFLPLIFIYVFIVLDNRRNIFKIILATLLFVALFGIVFAIIMKYSTSMAQRLQLLITQLLTDMDVDASYNERTWLRQTAWQLFLKYPIFGYGIGQFREYSLSIGGPYLYSHNNYVELLSNTGIIGFAIYYGMYAKILIHSLKGFLQNNSRLLLFSISFLVMNLVSDYATTSYYQYSYLFIISIASVLMPQKMRLSKHNALHTIKNSGGGGHVI